MGNQLPQIVEDHKEFSALNFQVTAAILWRLDSWSDFKSDQAEPVQLLLMLGKDESRFGGIYQDAYGRSQP